MTDNRTNYKDADAIVFHFRDFEWTVPSSRTVNQRYIFMLFESPPHAYNLHKVSGNNANFFNWTMTYRRDSDIVGERKFHVRDTNGVISDDVWKQV